MVDGSASVAVGMNGTIVKTTDLGITWETRHITRNALQGVAVHGNDRMVAVGTDGFIVSSSDGGSSWVERTSGTSETLREAVFLTEDPVVAVGHHETILRSTDGGDTWSVLQVGSQFLEYRSVC